MPIGGGRLVFGQEVWAVAGRDGGPHRGAWSAALRPLQVSAIDLEAFPGENK